MFILFVIVYLGMGVFVAGKMFAYWQRDWPEWLVKQDKFKDFLLSIVSGIAWPSGLIFLLIGKSFSSGRSKWKNGWTLNYKYPRKPSKEK